MAYTPQSASHFVQVSASVAEIEAWGVTLTSSILVGEGTNQCMQFRTAFATEPAFNYPVAGAIPLGFYAAHELFVRLPGGNLPPMVVACYGPGLDQNRAWVPAPAGRTPIADEPEVVQEAYRRARALGYGALLGV